MIIYVDDLKIKLRHQFLIKIKRFFRSFFSKNKPQFQTIRLQQKNGQQFTINTTADLRDILQYSPEKTAIYTALAPYLPELITSESVFFDLTRGLNTDQKTSLVRAFKAHLPLLIKTNQQLTRIVSNVHVEARLEVLQTLKDYLPFIIPDLFQLCDVLSMLNTDHQLKLLLSLTDHSPFKIENTHQLQRVIRDIDSNQRLILLSHLEDDLPTIIKTPTDLRFMLERFNSKRLLKMLERNQHVSKIIKTSDDLHKLLFLLDEEKAKGLLEVLDRNLATIIKTPTDLLPFSSSQKKDVRFIFQKNLAYDPFSPFLQLDDQKIEIAPEVANSLALGKTR